jgi:hypothetical protein
VLLIGTIGWALSGLRRGREAARLTAAGYTEALQETAAARLSAANGKMAATAAVVDVHACILGAVAAAGPQQQQQQQGSSLKHRFGYKAAGAGAAASSVISKQQHATTVHSIYKSRLPGSQVRGTCAHQLLQNMFLNRCRCCGAR